MHVACRDGADAVPPRPIPDGVDIHGLAAPGGEHDLGITSHHLVGIHDALGGALHQAQLGEDVPPPRDLDDLRHPTDSRDQRIVPLLEVHAWPIGPHARELPHLRDLVADVQDQRARAALQTQESAHRQDGVQDLGHRALIGAEDGHARPNQFRADLGLEVRERQHEIGLESQDPVGAKGGEAADLGLVPSLGGAVGRAGHADHPRPRSERVAGLDVVGAQADDALGELGAGLAVHFARGYFAPSNSSCRATPRWKPRYDSLVIRGFQDFKISRAASASPHSMSITMSASCLAGSTYASFGSAMAKSAPWPLPDAPPMYGCSVGMTWEMSPMSVEPERCPVSVTWSAP